jgi:hypothetical protein
LRLRGENIRIPARYQGPDGSGNGGYVCGRVAALVDGPVAEVTLRLPPPLESELRLEHEGEHVRLLDGDDLVAEARPAAVELEPPIVAWDEAEAATAQTTAFDEHEFPRCFVCGPLRADGDGLRILPGPVREGVVAAPWTAREVVPEIVWAAIDCVGAYAVGYPDRGSVLLGRMAARIDRLPLDGERCVVVGWSLGADGRKLAAGTALLGADGVPCAVSRQTWIQPKPT